MNLRNDDLLALAVKYPIEMRSQILQQAAWKASGAGDPARARQIALELISDPVQRRQVLEQLDSQAIWKAVSENRIAEARAFDQIEETNRFFHCPNGKWKIRW